MWWHERRATFPTLSRMARDYLSIPGKLVIFILVICSALIFCKLLLLTLSASLAVAASSCPMSAAVFLYNLLALLCVLALGAFWAWLRTMISGLPLATRLSERSRSSERIGMLSSGRSRSLVVCFFIIKSDSYQKRLVTATPYPYPYSYSSL
jgi:hAT family C-terminal dimerisation region